MASHPSQHPIGSGFTAADTALDVIAGIDLTKKVAIVTGGHSGVGLETTRALRSAGAHVIVPVRDPAKGRSRVAGIDGVEIDRLDLTDPASIDAFAARFVESGRPLHILVNSAGIMGVPLTRDDRGYELHFAPQLPRPLSTHGQTLAGAAEGWRGTGGERLGVGAPHVPGRVR